MNIRAERESVSVEFCSSYVMSPRERKERSVDHAVDSAHWSCVAMLLAVFVALFFSSLWARSKSACFSVPFNFWLARAIKHEVSEEHACAEFFLLLGGFIENIRRFNRKT